MSLILLLAAATLLTAEQPRTREAAFYPHRHEKHVGLQCRDCHTVRADKIDVKEFSGHATCVDCHNFAKEVVEREIAFCGVCHNSAEISKEKPALFAFPKTSVKPEMSIQFSHVAHKRAGPATRCERIDPRPESLCSDCHAAKPQGQRDFEASHAACFSCHCEHTAGGAQNPRFADCAACHVAADAIHVQPELSGKVKDFKHEDHRFDTRPRKKAATLDTSPDRLCAECHVSAARAAYLGEIHAPDAAGCRSCHTGRPGLPDELKAETIRAVEALR